MSSGATAVLADPHDRLRCLRHAGTNGKGVCATLERNSATPASGSASTSPHRSGLPGALPGGRSRRGGGLGGGVHRPLDAGRRAHRGGTSSEATTAMAFDWFARSGVDVAVIETGGSGTAGLHQCREAAGRRSDVDRDRSRGVPGRHARADRGREAGIFKHGVPAAIGEPDPAIAGYLLRTLAARSGGASRGQCLARRAAPPTSRSPKRGRGSRSPWTASAPSADATGRRPQASNTALALLMPEPPAAFWSREGAPRVRQAGARSPPRPVPS